MGKLGSGVGQGRISDPCEFVEEAEIFFVVMGLTEYMGEVG